MRDAQIVFGSRDIDYVVDLLNIPWWYFGIAIGLFLLLWLTTRKWEVGALVGYMFIIFSVTVLSRTSFTGLHFQPELFWSYRIWNIEKEQIILNIIGFIPLGLLGGKLIGWRSILLAAGVSAAVETLQLVSRRGLFEFDDIIHNSLGAVIGFLIIKLILKKYKGAKD